MNKSIALLRDVEATRIPIGETTHLSADTEVTITQSLGGMFTVAVTDQFGLFRIAGKDADALDLPVPEMPQIFNADGKLDTARLWELLKTCYDPEIPVNIVDLGLVYSLDVTPLENGEHRVEVKMTLTAPGCGMGPVIANDAKERLLSVPGVGEAEVEVVWDPLWNPSMISADGKAKLGIE